MARYDFRMQRLYVEGALAPDMALALTQAQSHYLAHVLRLEAGAPVLLFNGRDGEWQGHVTSVGKKGVTVTAATQTRAQETLSPVTYAFAPLKHARLDYMIQKAVEMGAGALQPVITQHTQATRLNLDRMRANVIEAAEQCGILALPVVGEEMKLPAFLAQRPAGQPLIFADEDAPPAEGMAALAALKGRALTVLIGPEGGFSDAERAILLAARDVIRLSLGPRILRADTAAVAALT
ncbi:MAG: 16S rRNA (uracil(1498)-N(3))-methyltransferase, partial [Beijerinckiaceae bacterium]